MNLPYHASGERDYITMRTMTVVRQYLAAAFLLVIGLIAYGCGDSATVNPVVELRSLAVTPGALQPAFSSTTTDYTVQLSGDVTSVTVTALQAVEGDSVSINGQATTSRAITLEPAGQTTVVNIVVSESNTNSRTYTVKLVRAGFGEINSLETLSVSPGKLSPAFTANEQLYRVDDIKSTDTKVTVTATPEDPLATMTVNGQDTASGQGREITLKPAGDITIIEIFVKAQNGQVKQYHIEVSRGKSRNNDLKNLTLSPGTLNQAFKDCKVLCTLNVRSVVPNNVTNVTVTPELADPTTATMTVNGQATTNKQARTAPLPAAGSSNFINIVVTAQDGSQKTYTVNVIRAALGGNNNLSALRVSPGSLDSAFNANDLSYTVNVGSDVTSITVMPTLEATTASMTVNGQATNSGQGRTITPLNPAGQTTLITIQVTAQNTISQKTYTVNVIRAALGGNDTLQSLTVSPGTLSPAFSVTRTLPYTVNDIGSSATSITVTATPQDSSATVTINNQGGNSRSIPLPGGPSSTEIEVLVRAPNGNDRTYSITVNQPAPAAPQAPSSAPDLIREDDTCPPGIPPAECAPDFFGNPTSKEDNVTTVKRPRFTVAPLAAGETPNLYVDGNIAKKGFDVGANTLTPTIALSEGTHTITSTVTNTATTLESPQSLLSLTVTIDTVAPGP